MTSEHKVKFKCTIKDKQSQDVFDTFDASRARGETIAVFVAWVTAQYQLPGQVKPFRGDTELKMLNMRLEELFMAAQDTLLVEFDSTSTTGAGGYGGGGAGDKGAFAKGGFGGGGGVTTGDVDGGHGHGGNVEGYGKGGDGIGGPANAGAGWERWATGGSGVGGSATLPRAK